MGLVVVARACTGAAGAGSITQAVAGTALARGASVTLAGPAGCEELAARLRDQSDAPGRLSFVSVDLASGDQIDASFDAVFETLPELHGFVNVLGPVQTPASAAAPREERRLLGDMTLADWNGAMAAWLRTPFLLTRRIVDEFLWRGEGGRIVHIMPAAEAGQPGVGVRLVAGRAMAAFIRTVAKEYGRRQISCNGVAVTARFAAEQAGRCDRGAEEGIPGLSEIDSGGAPYRRHMPVAEAALFLASGAASFVNGEVMQVADVPDLSRAAGAGYPKGRIS